MSSRKETNSMMKRICLFGISYCVLAVLLFPQSNGERAFQPQADITPTPEHVDSHDEISINGGLAWSPDGDFLAVGTTAGVSIHQSDDLSLHSRIAEHLIVSALDWGVSNQIVIGAESGVMEIWNTQEKLLELAGHTGPIVVSVVFSPDGEWIASSGYDGLVLVWDAQTGDLKQSIVPSEYFSYDPVDWSPDSRYVVTRLNSDTQAEIMVWDVNSEQIHLSWRNQIDTRALRWSPDGAWIVAGRSDAIVLWDAATGSLSKMIENERWSGVDALAWSPDSQRLATVSGKYNEDGDEIYYTFPLRIHDFVTDETFLLADNVIITGDAFYANAIAWSPDGSQLAAVSDDGKVFIWDVRSRVLLATYEDYESILLPGFKVRSGITPEPEQLVSLFENYTCAPPCWFGIVPGKSHARDVKLALQPWVDSGVLGADFSGLSANVRFPVFWPYSTWWDYERAFTNNTIVIEGDVVRFIDILMNRHVTLREVIETYGMPSFTLASSDLAVTLSLVYLDKQMAIALTEDEMCNLPTLEDDMRVLSVEYYMLEELSARLERYINRLPILDNPTLQGWLDSDESISCAAAIVRMDKFYTGLPTPIPTN